MHRIRAYVDTTVFGGTQDGELTSYAQFVRETAATDPKMQAFRERIAEAQRDPTSDAVASDARARR